MGAHGRVRLLLAAALACVRTEPPESLAVVVPSSPVAATVPASVEPPADPGPPPLRYASIPAGHQRLVGVSQAPVFLHAGLWTFADHRPQLYTESADGCAIFDIPSGRIVSRSAPGDITTCDQWLRAMYEPPASLDSALRVGSRGATLEIVDDEGVARHSLACGGCEYVAHSQQSGGHRVAALTLDPPRIDIWDADAGTRIEQQSLAVPGERFDARLVWNERGVVVLIEHDEPMAHDSDIDPLHDVSAWFWPNAGTIQPRPRLVRETTLSALDVDPSARWMLVYSEVRERGGDVRRRLTTIPLTDQPSALDWSWIEPDPGREQSVELGRRWRADATTQWLEARIESTQIERKLGRKLALTMSWRALVVDPAPSVHGRELHRGKPVDEDRVSPKLSLFGVAGDEALIDWAVDEFDPRSRGARIGLRHCNTLDASPQLRYLLADCDRRTLALVDLHALDDDDLGVAMRLDVGLESEFIWGRSGWLVIRDPGGKLLLIDPETRTTRLERDGVDALARLALGPNLDRLGILVGDRFELIDGTSGATLLELPRFEGRAGLHPDGQRLAAILAGRVQVIAVASGEVLVSWSEPKMIDVAWRQDGLALLVGAGVPEQVVDPSNGELLATLRTGDWLLLTSEGMDPSWRWAQLSDGRILRTIDGMGLSFGPSWVRLDCGLIEATRDARDEATRAFLYRSGDDPQGVPRLEAAAVRPWLIREGSLAAFFAGEVITPPSIPEAELDKLLEGRVR